MQELVWAAVLLVLAFLFFGVTIAPGGGRKHKKLVQTVLLLKDLDQFVEYCRKHREQLPLNVQEQLEILEEKIKERIKKGE